MAFGEYDNDYQFHKGNFANQSQSRWVLVGALPDEIYKVSKKLIYNFICIINNEILIWICPTFVFLKRWHARGP